MCAQHNEAVNRLDFMPTRDAITRDRTRPAK